MPLRLSASPAMAIKVLEYLVFIMIAAEIISLLCYRIVLFRLPQDDALTGNFNSKFNRNRYF